MDLSLLRVLIIDDIEMARVVVRNMLTKVGVADSHIFELNSAIPAIELIVDKKIDLVISDWSMPGMDGIDLLKAIKEHEGLKDVNFIMTTSISDRQRVEIAHNNGISDFLLKPFSFAIFKDKLLKIVQKR